MTRVAPLLALLCTGCFSVHPLEEGESGARLELIAWAPEDGSGVHATHFFDRELGVECRFRWDYDADEWRCLPNAHARPIFLDASCREPAAHACATAGESFVTAGRLEDRTHACGGGGFAVDVSTPARVLDERVVERAWQLDPSGACVELELDDQRVSALEPLPLDMFVRGELRPRPREGSERVGRRVIAGEDGSELVLGHYDHELGAACYVATIADGPLPCVVESVGNAYDSRECGGPWGIVREALLPSSGCEITPTELFLTTETNECGLSAAAQIHRAGEPVPRETVEACIERPTTATYVTLVDASDEVAWIDNEPEGTGRVRRFRGRPDVASYVGSHGDFYDEALGVECTALDLHGTKRCLPVLARPLGSDPLYADDACEERVARQHTSTACASFTYHWQRGAPSACADYSDRTYYRVGEAIDVAFERDEDGACVPVELRMGERVHRLEAVPDETFAAFRRI